MNRSFHEGYEGSSCLVEELLMVGYARFERARQPLSAHIHPRAFEIFYIDRGRTEWWTGNETYEVGAHNVLINRPGENHGSTGSSRKPCGYLWIQLLFDKNQRLPGLSPAISRSIYSTLTTSERSFAASTELREWYMRILQELRSPTSWSKTNVRAYLHLLLAQLVKDSTSQKTHSQPNYSYAIRQALRMIDGNLPDVLTVRQLATASRLSPGHFRQRFFNEVGFAPSAYITLRRIERGKHALHHSHKSISEIAHELGFSSSQHFATVFKKIEGSSPSKFRGNHF